MHYIITFAPEPFNFCVQFFYFLFVLRRRVEQNWFYKADDPIGA